MYYFKPGQQLNLEYGPFSLTTYKLFTRASDFLFSIINIDLTINVCLKNEH